MVFGKVMNSMLALTASLVAVSAVHAATVPFTEDFVATNENWKDNASADLTYVSSGGPDGSSYVATGFNFASAASGDTPVLFRGYDSFDSSSDAFVGNYLSEGVNQFSAYVYHEAAMPLTFFARFSSSVNYPGATALQFVPVMPYTWTQIVIDISPTSPQFISFEGTDFNAVFSGIGNIQIGVSVPDQLAGVDSSIEFALDKPTITPEPASLSLLAMGGLALLRRR